MSADEDVAYEQPARPGNTAQEPKANPDAPEQSTQPGTPADVDANAPELLAQPGALTREPDVNADASEQSTQPGDSELQEFDIDVELAPKWGDSAEDPDADASMTLRQLGEPGPFFDDLEGELSASTIHPPLFRAPTPTLPRPPSPTIPQLTYSEATSPPGTPTKEETEYKPRSGPLNNEQRRWLDDWTEKGKAELAAKAREWNVGISVVMRHCGIGIKETRSAMSWNLFQEKWHKSEARIEGGQLFSFISVGFRHIYTFIPCRICG